jgi:hypothetical protein
MKKSGNFSEYKKLNGNDYKKERKLNKMWLKG